MLGVYEFLIERKYSQVHPAQISSLNYELVCVYIYIYQVYLGFDVTFHRKSGTTWTVRSMPLGVNLSVGEFRRVPFSPRNS